MYRIILIAYILIAQTYAIELKMYKPDQYAYAKRVASQEKKVLVLYYSAKWCNYCKQMENNIFKNDKFVKAMKDKIIMIKYDVNDKKIKLPVKSTGSVPSFYFLDPNNMFNITIYQIKGATLNIDKAIRKYTYGHSLLK